MAGVGPPCVYSLRHQACKQSIERVENRKRIVIYQRESSIVNLLSDVLNIQLFSCHRFIALPILDIYTYIENTAG